MFGKKSVNLNLSLVLFYIAGFEVRCHLIASFEIFNERY